jgi:MFS transporter, SP family, general alpha glucoside:H+ symporter
MVESATRNAIEPLRFPRKDELEHSPAVDQIIENAKAATAREQKMSLWQGIKLYPKAVGWSVLISTCIAMEGYDQALINNFYGFPVFNRKYGQPLLNGTYQVPVRVCGTPNSPKPDGEISGGGNSNKKETRER